MARNGHFWFYNVIEKLKYWKILYLVCANKLQSPYCPWPAGWGNHGACGPLVRTFMGFQSERLSNSVD